MSAPIHIALREQRPHPDAGERALLEQRARLALAEQRRARVERAPRRVRSMVTLLVRGA
jgi:hypothetical protein